MTDAPPGSHGKRLRGVDTDAPVGFAAGFGREVKVVVFVAGAEVL